MESSATTQLPEADSLPDGFVESLESKASMVLLGERGKQLDECKDNMSIKLDILSDSSNGASLDGSVLAGGQVTLPEKHSYYGSEQSANVADEGCMEQREGHLVIWPESTSTSTASPGSDLQASTIAEKGKGNNTTAPVIVIPLLPEALSFSTDLTLSEHCFSSPSSLWVVRAMHLK